MQIEKAKEIKTQEEARQFAIDWQLNFETQNYDYMDLANWGAVMEGLAVKFDLVDEFKENGII